MGDTTEVHLPMGTKSGGEVEKQIPEQASQWSAMAGVGNNQDDSRDKLKAVPMHYSLH